MIDFQAELQQLTENLSILRERKASYGDDFPVALLNQITDHETAISLTEQARQGQLSETNWREALRPLLVNIHDRSESEPDICGVTIGDVDGDIINSIIAGGDVTAGGDIVTGVQQTAHGRNIAQAAPGGTATVNVYPTPPRDKNLTILLGNVRKIWVEDYLNSALLNAICLDLGLQEKRDAVPQPFENLNIGLRQPEQAEQNLPPGTRAVDVYRQAGGGLLILGQPGAGKTTALATLARELLTEAKDDPAAPVPVIFNLSSWATEQKPLTDWLTEELNQQYQVSRKLGQRWLAEGRLALLLDGLDEVAADRRESCVAAINAYCGAEAAGPLVVCSRLHDYESLQAKLKLGQAIALKKLTRLQVEDYFERLQTNRPTNNQSSLVERIWQDEALRDLTQTPLMLNIIALTYAHPHPPPLPQGSGESLRTQIFDAYSDYMFHRLGRTKTELLHPKAQTLHYLRYLALQLQNHNLTQFSIGPILATWLPDGKIRRRYHWLKGLIIWLIFGLIFGLFVGLIFGLFVGLIFGLFGWLILGLFSWLILGLITWLIRWLIRWLFSWLFNWLFNWLIGAEPSGTLRLFWWSLLIFGLIFGLFGGLIFGLIGGLINGLSVGLIFGLIGGLRYGGEALIQHYLRLYLLNKHNLLPFKLIPFLDQCTELIFLQRLGGSYRFIHRTLQEHFAAQWEGAAVKTEG